MNENQRAALLISQSIAAIIEAMGMQAENEQRKTHGYSMAYTMEDFVALNERFGLYHNQALSLLQG